MCAIFLIRQKGFLMEARVVEPEVEVNRLKQLNNNGNKDIPWALIWVAIFACFIFMTMLFSTNQNIAADAGGALITLFVLWYIISTFQTT